ncbi:MAG: cell division protein FtsZ [Patescibacteria group bacterium]
MAKNKLSRREQLRKRPQLRGRGLKIKVVGVGGAGCSIISRLMKSKIPNLELIAINTDSQSLARTSAHKKIKIGKRGTKGSGTGMNVNLGQQAAEISRKEIIGELRGTDLIFLVAGLGGGVGSGALPVIAEISRELGILTIALVTKPFIFEGLRRMAIAEQTIKILATKVDALISIANERLLKVIDRTTPLLEAFGIIDKVLEEVVGGITEVINSTGLVNVDSTDLKTILKDAGQVLLGIGTAEGESRAIQAVKKAIENPLFDFSIKGAKGIIFVVTGGPDLTMYEVNEMAKYIYELADQNCQINFGVVIDELMEGKIKVAVIATGFSSNNLEQSQGVLIKPQSIFEKKVEIEKIQLVKKEPEIRSKIVKLDKDVNEDELEIPTFLRKKK